MEKFAAAADWYFANTAPHGHGDPPKSPMIGKDSGYILSAGLWPGPVWVR